jgi:hypothetical protein
MMDHNNTSVLERIYNYLQLMDYLSVLHESVLVVGHDFKNAHNARWLCSLGRPDREKNVLLLSINFRVLTLNKGFAFWHFVLATAL